MENILITGSSSGIGEDIALKLLQKGYTVYGLVRNVSKLHDVLSNSENFFSVVCDLKNSVEISVVLRNLRNEGVSFTGVVFAAGVEESLPIKLYDFRRVSEIFGVNVFSQFHILSELSKKDFLVDGASIVTLSSVMSVLGQPGKSAYSASKAALIGMVKSLSLELATRRIRINAISPGVVQTPMTLNLFNQISIENRERIVRMHPLGLGQTASISSMALFLLGDESVWLTGQNLIVDGGYSNQ
jgi:NAD(P)-dependent dehydrogenase (short-subunit alcohol dehydrogenase family)